MDRKKKYILEGATVEIKFEDYSLDDFVIKLYENH